VKARPAADPVTAATDPTAAEADPPAAATDPAHAAADPVTAATDQAAAEDRDRRFAALFRGHHARVQAYFLRRTGDLELARDLAAEVFRLAWERATTPPATPPTTPPSTSPTTPPATSPTDQSPTPPTNPPTTTSPTVPSPPWLFATARNLLANHWRRVATNERLRDVIVGNISRQRWPGGVAGPEGEGDAAADRVALALADLPEQHREILMAHYWDGLVGAEIAALLGCSQPAVWMRLTRARAAFRLAFTTLEESR
jgi:RNA polymerase sigma-70 factor (ECF subfamily)